MNGVMLAAHKCALEVRYLPAVKPLLKASVKGGSYMGLITVEALVIRESSVIGNTVAAGHRFYSEINHSPAGLGHSVACVTYSR